MSWNLITVDKRGGFALFFKDLSTKEGQLKGEERMTGCHSFIYSVELEGKEQNNGFNQLIVSSSFH